MILKKPRSPLCIQLIDYDDFEEHFESNMKKSVEEHEVQRHGIENLDGRINLVRDLALRVNIEDVISHKGVQKRKNRLESNNQHKLSRTLL